MEDNNPQIKPFLRIMNTDLVGTKNINMALLKIKGVGFNAASAICNLTGINKNAKAGLLNPEEVKKIEELLTNNNLPSWMLNHRKDLVSGEDKHFIGADLKFNVDNDIKVVRRLKTYKGMRHSAGLPVRGQRTRAHFRKGRALGVQKSKVKSGK